MKPSAYLDAVKAQLNITSDYELGKRMGLPWKSIPAIRKETRAVPLDIAYKIAITLQLDPAQVVADLAEQREKNEQRREFWRGFLSRANTWVAVLVCTLALSFSAISGSAARPHFGSNRRYA